MEHKTLMLLDTGSPCTEARQVKLPVSLVWEVFVGWVYWLA